MGESPWYIGKMGGDFITNIICIYIFLANLSRLYYLVKSWRIFHWIIKSWKIFHWIIKHCEVLANILLKYETIYDNNETYSLNCNILTYMFGKEKHNFHFLQTMLQVLVTIFVMVGGINVFSTTFVKLPLFPSYQISFLLHRLQLRNNKKKNTSSLFTPTRQQVASPNYII